MGAIVAYFMSYLIFDRKKNYIYLYKRSFSRDGTRENITQVFLSAAVALCHYEYSIETVSSPNYYMNALRTL